MHHQGQGLPGGAGGAGQHDVVGIDDAEPTFARLPRRAIGLSGHGRGLAGHRRHVQLDRPVEEAGIRADRRPFLQDHQIARDHTRCVHDLTVPIPDDGCMRRQVARQCGDRMLGVPLLNEGETGVDGDHADDRDPKRQALGSQCQCGREPKQQCQWVGELAPECVEQAARLLHAEEVGPGDGEALLRLGAGQPGAVAVQALEQDARLHEQQVGVGWERRLEDRVGTHLSTVSQLPRAS